MSGEEKGVEAFICSLFRAGEWLQWKTGEGGREREIGRERRERGERARERETER